MDGDKSKAYKIGAYDSMILHIANGHMSYLSALYEDLRASIFTYALSILHDYYTAEDIMQETFLKVNMHADEYRKGTNARAWIFSIVRNLALDEIRKHKREDALTDAIKDGENPGDDIAGSAIEFMTLLNSLDEMEKEIIVLRFSGNLRFKEIANVMRIAPCIARSRFYRAVKKLKRDIL